MARIYFLDPSYQPDKDDGSVAVCKGDEDSQAEITKEERVARFPMTEAALVALDVLRNEEDEGKKDSDILYAAQRAWSRQCQPIQNAQLCRYDSRIKRSSVEKYKEVIQSDGN